MQNNCMFCLSFAMFWEFKTNVIFEPLNCCRQLPKVHHCRSRNSLVLTKKFLSETSKCMFFRDHKISHEIWSCFITLSYELLKILKVSNYPEKKLSFSDTCMYNKKKMQFKTCSTLREVRP